MTSVGAHLARHLRALLGKTSEDAIQVSRGVLVEVARLVEVAEDRIREDRIRASDKAQRPPPEPGQRIAWPLYVGPPGPVRMVKAVGVITEVGGTFHRPTIHARDDASGETDTFDALAIAWRPLPPRQEEPPQDPGATVIPFPRKPTK